MYFFKPLLIVCVLFHQEIGVCSAIEDMWNATAVIEMKQGSNLSSRMSYFRGEKYELASGAAQNITNWYQPNFSDIRITYLTKIDNEFGVIWGFSIGERAQKYSIDPSIKLGLAFHHDLDKSSSVSFRLTSILGGRLRESACTADYGSIGGVQQVNCRMAASSIEPSQTLQYLFNERPYNYNTMWLRYALKF
jgi:hypothetical protein